MKIKTISFNGRLSQAEIPYFRAAIVKEVGEDSVLLHNHKDEGLRYSYPLVQYKCVDGRPMVTAIGDAVTLFDSFHATTSLQLNIGNRQMDTMVLSIHEEDYEPVFTESPIEYGVKRYIPLTGTNVSEFRHLIAFTDKVEMLEGKIVGNLLSFFKGLGVHIQDELKVVISDITDRGVFRYKNVDFMTFNLQFVSNILLPNNIGIGKSSSIGMGNIHLIRTIDA